MPINTSTPLFECSYVLICVRRELYYNWTRLPYPLSDGCFKNQSDSFLTYCKTISLTFSHWDVHLASLPDPLSPIFVTRERRRCCVARTQSSVDARESRRPCASPLYAHFCSSFCRPWTALPVHIFVNSAGVANWPASPANIPRAYSLLTILAYVHISREQLMKTISRLCLMKLRSKSRTERK